MDAVDYEPPQTPRDPDSNRVITVRVKQRLYDQVTVAAHANKISMNAWCINALKSALEKSTAVATPQERAQS